MLRELIKGDITQKEILNYYNANVTIINLPEGINGFVYNYKSIYNIFINSDLSYYKRKKTLLHELAHIELNHQCQYNKDLFAFHIKRYEDEADRYVEFLQSIESEVYK